MGVYRRKDSPYWWMLLERRGKKPLREPSGIPIEGGSTEQNKELKRQAQEIYAARMTVLARQAVGLPTDEPDPDPPPTLRSFAAWYDTHVTAKNRGAERERELAKQLLAPRTDDDGDSVALADLPLPLITRVRVTEWMTARLSRTVAAVTVNREIDLLKSMLRKAAELGHLAISPLVGMKRLRVTKPKRRLMSDAELASLLKVADPIDQALILVGHDALVRFGDILDLRRQDVRGKWAFIADPKDPVQGEPFEVPLSDRARKALAAIPAATGPYYFARYRVAKTERDRRSSWRQKLERLCDTAHPKIPYGRKRGGLTFHWATRRSGASKLIAQGKDLKTVQALGHWKNPELVLDIYTETERRRLLEAVHRKPRKSIKAATPQSRDTHATNKRRENVRKTA